MSMHLVGPWLTTTGKVRSKRRKFATAEAARKSRELAQEWQQRQQQWQDMAPRFSTGTRPLSHVKSVSVSPSYPPGREPTRHIPSLNGGCDSPGAVGARQQDKVYTGDKIKGIGTLHKSNAVPVFTDDEAVDLARMRR